ISLNPHAINAIEDIQPYQQRGNYSDDLLWQISDLDNIDKHRRLHLTAAATTEQSPRDLQRRVLLSQTYIRE
ncbi:MAG: hypothetical protein LC790_04140, partial [Actinobacteria bacterium]|nr:hypothetical protein [Actinomycetota bacterium]